MMYSDIFEAIEKVCRQPGVLIYNPILNLMPLTQITYKKSSDNCQQLYQRNILKLTRSYEDNHASDDIYK